MKENPFSVAFDDITAGRMKKHVLDETLHSLKFIFITVIYI